MKVPNIIIGSIIICLASFFFINTYQFPDLQLEEVGPALMPRIYCVILGILGVALIIKGIREKHSQEKKEKTMIYVLMAMLIVFVYILIIPFVGFYISTFAFTLAFIIYSRVRNKLIIITIPISTILFIFIFFEKVLKVSIPTGVLFS